MLDTLKQFLRLLDVGERRRFWTLQALVIVQGAADAAAAISVAPFIHVLTNPDVAHTMPFYRTVQAMLALDTPVAVTIAMGAGVLATLLAANAVGAVIAYWRTRFIFDILASVSTRLLEGYLNRDYAYFLRRDTASLAKNVLSETNEFITQFVTPFLNALARALPALIVIAAVSVVDWRVTAGIGVVFVGAYVAMDVMTRTRQTRLGADRVRANEGRYRVISEAFGAIKEVKLFGTEAFHVRRFAPVSASFADAKAFNRTATQTASYALESLLIGGLIAFSLVLLARGVDLADVAPTLGLFAMTLLRLLPSMNDMLRNSAAFHFNAGTVDHLASQLHESHAPSRSEDPRRVVLQRELVLDQVTFRYADDRPFSLDAVSIRIPARSTMGIVGRSGAGKSTLADLILGLLEPQSGQITVDGVLLDRSNRRAWQRSVGYVPQVINLVNATVAENIAFGLEPAQIDRARVEEVARLADVHDFVVSGLPRGYDTPLGERGITLSGGQRQRIGIARALYRNPTLLVFDEATTALDTATETAVLEAIARLSGQLTLVLIAHRQSTLNACDVVVRIEAGRVHTELVHGAKTAARTP